MGLSQAIKFGNDLIKESGIPIQDYKIHNYNFHNKRGKIENKRFEAIEKVKQEFLDEI